MNHDQSRGGNGKWSPATKYAFIGFLLVAGYFLITEHRAHVFQYLPFLLLAACPLMHLFHGHGGHQGHGADEKKSSDSDPESRKENPDASQHHH